jgi:hypothetical protein
LIDVNHFFLRSASRKNHRRRSLTGKFQVISMAAALSRTLSDSNSGMKLYSGERQASE